MGVPVNQHVGRIHFFSGEIINNCSPPQKRINLRFQSTCEIAFSRFHCIAQFWKVLKISGFRKKHINRGGLFGLGFFFFFLRATVGVVPQYSFQNITVRKASKAKRRKQDSLLCASGKHNF